MELAWLSRDYGFEESSGSLKCEWRFNNILTKSPDTQDLRCLVPRLSLMFVIEWLDTDFS